MEAYVTIIILILGIYFLRKFIRRKYYGETNPITESNRLMNLKATTEVFAIEIIRNSRIDLRKKGLSENDLDFMSNYIKEYIENKFISKRDLSFVEFYKYQDYIRCDNESNEHPYGAEYAFYPNLDKFNDVSVDSIEFRCDICKDKKLLSYKEYQEWSFYGANQNIPTDYTITDNQMEILKEKYKDYLDDQKKLHGLFIKNDIHINYFKMIPLMNKIERDVFNHYSFNFFINPAYERIKQSLENNIDVISIIKRYLRISPELNIPTIISEKITKEYEGWMIKEILNKFEVPVTSWELPELIDLSREQNSIETFEKTLGKEKIPILYDFTDLNGVEFEKYVRNVFHHLGYDVSETRTTGDQGADLLLNKAQKKTVVQVKNHNKNVSNKAIQEAVAAMKYYNASHAMVVVSSSFTQGAIDLALKNEVELWDGQKLIDTVRHINDR